MGQWVDIPLITPVNQNVDEVQLAQSGAECINLVPVIVDGQLQLKKRPGLRPFFDGAFAPQFRGSVSANTGVTGLYWWDRQGFLIRVHGISVDVFGVTNGGGIVKGAPAIFASDGNHAVIATGETLAIVYVSAVAGNIWVVEEIGTGLYPNAPTQATHIVNLDGYFLANVAGTGTVKFSAINDPFSWNALDFFTAESKADEVMALGEASSELVLLGRETVEFWINDGQTPFSRIPGATQPHGTTARYSLASLDGVWMWLNQYRRIVTMRGRQVTPMVTPYDRVIQKMRAVEDARAYILLIDGVLNFVLTFPSERFTIAYHDDSKIWYRLSGWDSEAGTFTAFPGNCAAYSSATKEQYVGSNQDYSIKRLTNGLYTDFSHTVNGFPPEPDFDKVDIIPCVLRTGHLSHGISSGKISDCLRLQCKRGQGSPTSVPSSVGTYAVVEHPQIAMRQRVDNKAWSNERWKSLGVAGEHEQFIDWRRNGIYKSCQREFIHTDATDLVLIKAQEYIEVLDR